MAYPNERAKRGTSALLLCFRAADDLGAIACEQRQFRGLNDDQLIKNGAISWPKVPVGVNLANDCSFHADGWAKGRSIEPAAHPLGVTDVRYKLQATSCARRFYGALDDLRVLCS